MPDDKQKSAADILRDAGKTNMLEGRTIRINLQPGTVAPDDKPKCVCGRPALHRGWSDCLTGFRPPDDKPMRVKCPNPYCWDGRVPLFGSQNTHSDTTNTPVTQAPTRACPTCGGTEYVTEPKRKEQDDEPTA